ncbi:MAG: DUF523 and DUF1722 domain-containing protein [Cellvibrionaceae bacterium]|nr:DUF523 and DUF1722 domain-containing protein [Cellvibrionaceae bacterium]
MQLKNKIPVGISACLLGEQVRYNGGHKQSRFCLQHLSKVFDFSAFCPEVAIGLGIPREPIRLVGSIEAPRVVGTESHAMDVTDALFDYGVEIARQTQHLAGYILMSKSPSCALASAKIYNEKGSLPGKHAGMFVRGFRRQNPLLPLEEEARLNDPALRENFIARVFAYHDWRHNVAGEPSARAVVAYHSRYKYLLMSHSQAAYKQLGQFVAKAGLMPLEQLTAEYLPAFMTAISQPATRKGHANTLFHILGYLREAVSGEVRQDLANKIEDYRKGVVNLAVPMALLNHYLHMHGSEYIQSQAYLQPHCYDLGLRNAI